MVISNRHGTESSATVTAYKGAIFRSALEASWARNLDHYGISWRYEPQYLRLSSGAGYLPDFWLPELRTFIEVKGAHMQRADKPRELAAVTLSDGVVVLLGFSPMRRCLTPPLWDSFTVWRDPLGYDTRFTRCEACRNWQWIRASISRGCRICGTRITGLLARSGEMPFAEPPDGSLNAADFPALRPGRDAGASC